MAKRVRRSKKMTAKVGQLITIILPNGYFLLRVGELEHEINIGDDLVGEFGLYYPDPDDETQAQQVLRMHPSPQLLYQ